MNEIELTITINGNDFGVQVDVASNLTVITDDGQVIMHGTFNQPYYGSWMFRDAQTRKELGSAASLHEAMQFIAESF